MIYCHPIKEDYFEIKILEIKQAYFKANYIKSADLANNLLIEVSKYSDFSKERTEILSYKRLSDFQIESNLLKTKINVL